MALSFNPNSSSQLFVPQDGNNAATLQICPQKCLITLFMRICAFLGSSSCKQKIENYSKEIMASRVWTFNPKSGVIKQVDATALKTLHRSRIVAYETNGVIQTVGYEGRFKSELENLKNEYGYEHTNVFNFEHSSYDHFKQDLNDCLKYVSGAELQDLFDLYEYLNTKGLQSSELDTKKIQAILEQFQCENKSSISVNLPVNNRHSVSKTIQSIAIRGTTAKKAIDDAIKGKNNALIKENGKSVKVSYSEHSGRTAAKSGD
jgi:hypothetical protein